MKVCLCVHCLLTAFISGVMQIHPAAKSAGNLLISPRRPSSILPQLSRASVLIAVWEDGARCKGWRLPGDCFNRLLFLWRWRAGQDELLFTSLQLINRQKWSSGEQTPIGAAQTQRPWAASVAMSHSPQRWPPELLVSASQKSRTACLVVNDVIR